MLAHFFHMLQLLNMACFAPLKKAYGTQIEKLVRARISHIIKEDFLPAFCDAFKKSLTESNIRASFQRAGLVPLNPDCERKSQCCHQIERLGVQSYVMKVLSSICSPQPANTVNMLLRSS
jgi:hypothetical protein